MLTLLASLTEFFHYKHNTKQHEYGTKQQQTMQNNTKSHLAQGPLSASSVTSNFVVDVLARYSSSMLSWHTTDTFLGLHCQILFTYTVLNFSGIKVLYSDWSTATTAAKLLPHYSHISTTLSQHQSHQHHTFAKVQRCSIRSGAPLLRLPQCLFMPL
jgi:hypothetical protein